MPSLNKSDLVTEVRRQIDEIVLSGESTVTDDDIESNAASHFSDNDIEERLLDGVRYLASRIRANYLNDLVTSGDPTGSWDFGNVLRVIRVIINGERAKRRSFFADINHENAGRSATDSYPAYVYEDVELFLRDSGTASTDSSISDALNDSSPEVYYVKEPSAVSDMSDRFKAAVIQYVVSDLFITLQKGELANAARKRMFNIIDEYVLPRGQENEQE